MAAAADCVAMAHGICISGLGYDADWTIESTIVVAAD